MTRDLDLLAATPGVSVGFSIPTDDDEVRKVLEPHAPPIGARLSALRQLHRGRHRHLGIHRPYPAHESHQAL